MPQMMNLQKIIDLQLQDAKGSGSGGFGRFLARLLLGRETLRSGEISLDAAQSNYDIARDGGTVFWC